jgi:hypothetical protein
MWPPSIVASKQNFERLLFLFLVFIFQVLTAARYRVFERRQGHAANAIESKNACTIFKDLNRWPDADADRAVQYCGSFPLAH